MAKKKKAAKKSKKKPAVDYVVKSKVKERFKKNKCFTSSDVMDGLNNVIAWYIDQSSARAKANKRKTVRMHDIIIP